MLMIVECTETANIYRYSAKTLQKQSDSNTDSNKLVITWKPSNMSSWLIILSQLKLHISLRSSSVTNFEIKNVSSLFGQIKLTVCC